MRYSPIQKYNLNFFLSQTSGQISKIYKFVIRRQFLSFHHPSFENQWILVFKWGNNPNISKIKDEINSLKINSDKQRAGLRQCIGNGMPLDIIKPSYESFMAVLRTEIHIVRFKSYPTGAIRHCLKCDDEINNTLHNFYHCPVATFMWDIARDTIKILLGVNM